MAARKTAKSRTKKTVSSPEERPETSAPGTGDKPARVNATVLMRRKLFVLYMAGEADGNATLAAEMCGYSKRSAHELGSRLARDPLIAAEIERKRAQILAKAEVVAVVDKARILKELERLALADPREMFAVDGQLLAVRDMPEDIRRSIKSVKVFAGKLTTEISFWSKPDTLIQLGRELGCTFPQRHELTGAGGAPIATAEVELTESERRARVAALFAGLLTK